MRSVVRRAVRVSGPWSLPLALLLWVRVLAEAFRFAAVLVLLAIFARLYGWWPS